MLGQNTLKQYQLHFYVYLMFFNIYVERRIKTKQKNSEIDWTRNTLKIRGYAMFQN
jgi:hypothetical protein